MYFINSKHDNKYGVVDTRDDTEEFYTVEQLVSIVKSTGVHICGMSLSTGIPVIKCTSDSVFKDFVNSVKPTLARLKLMGVLDQKKQVEGVQKLGITFGVIQDVNELTIDINNSKMFIKSPAFNTFIDFTSGDTISKLDVCDKRVMELSTLGTLALSNITLTLSDGITITMLDVANEIDKVCSMYSNFNIDDIVYIGITPSNKMFKVVLSGGDIYSVKLDTYDKAFRDRDKILNSKVKKFISFPTYFNNCLFINKKRYMITKFTYKKARFRNLNKLKEKYPTLHDVYRRV